MTELPLGKQLDYPQHYSPQVLAPIPRADNRLTLGIGETLPFHGVDIWNIYEVSWLDERGKPVVAMLRMGVPCTSPHLVESKSLKLYFNSFNQERFASVQVLEKLIQQDLAAATGAQVTLEWDMLNSLHQSLRLPKGECLDDLALETSRYQPDSALLQWAEGGAGEEVEERLYSNLFRSNCPITGQPDWATVSIDYRGRAISHPALLQYLVSYRLHDDFHENCVERIFMDITTRCQPGKLRVEANFTRRGGIDINPVRSSEPEDFQAGFSRHIRQ